jgi:hypothetical protein
MALRTHLTWSKKLAAVGALFMAVLELVFYSSADKTLLPGIIEKVGFVSVFVGIRVFAGAPLTRTVDTVFNLYLIICTAIEGFVLGLCIDLIQKWRRQRCGQTSQQS